MILYKCTYELVVENTTTIIQSIDSSLELLRHHDYTLNTP